MSSSPFLHLVFFLSGVAGLGYEIVWTRMLAGGLGHEYPATLAVIASFFGGLAIGAALLDGPIARSHHAGRWAAACELAIGVWALATLFLIPGVNEALSGWIGLNPTPLRQWAISFAGPLLVLLPATAAMGATLPAMERLSSRILGRGELVAGLYAANTAGAVTGVFLSTYAALPFLGFRATLAAMAMINLFCAMALWFGPARREASLPAPPVRAQPTVRSTRPPMKFRLGYVLLLTGVLGVGYEVLAIRVLTQVLEDTIYTFAGTLGVYLLGTACGAALFQAFGTSASRPAAPGTRGQTPAPPARDPSGWLLIALCVACACEIPLLSRAGEIYDNARSLLGDSYAASILAEIALAAVAVWMPTLLMGATFSALAQRARTKTGSVGRALAINTLGGAVAPALAGVGALPVLGAKYSLLLTAAAYLVAAPLRLWRGMLLGGAAIALAAMLSGDLTLVYPHADQKVLAVRQGVQATASVIQTRDNERLLKVNRSFLMGGTGRAAFAQLRMGHIPLRLHPNPRQALFLGLGTAITFAAAAEYEGLLADGVELLPEVVQLLPEFGPEAAPVFATDRLRIYTADARRFVRCQRQRYDVIVADLFHPARDGAAGLYTVEHFLAIRDRLSEDGLFCQWLPLYQLDRPTLASIVAAFHAAFERGAVCMAYFNLDTPVLGLLGVVGEGAYLRTTASPPRESAALSAALRSVDLATAVELYGTLIGDLGTLDSLVRDVPAVNTDDHPVVTFLAPRRAYLATNPGPELMLTLLQTARGVAAPGTMPALDRGRDALSDFEQRVLSYRAARDEFLMGQQAARAGDPSGAAEFWLGSLAYSSDFDPAYGALMLLSREQARKGVGPVHLWLREAARLRPERPEARALLRQLYGQ